jgi:hypothetical protein
MEDMNQMIYSKGRRIFLRRSQGNSRAHRRRHDGELKKA